VLPPDLRRLQVANSGSRYSAFATVPAHGVHAINGGDYDPKRGDMLFSLRCRDKESRRSCSAAFAQYSPLSIVSRGQGD
jgi:hypothetical protein